MQPHITKALSVIPSDPVRMHSCLTWPRACGVVSQSEGLGRR